MSSPSLRVDDVLSEFPGAIFLTEGGQKQVFRLDHPSYGPSVLKVALPSSSAGAERIRREVQVLREIRSDYFPQNYEFRELDGGRYLMIEERIEGQTLADCMAGFSSVQDATRLVIHLVNALQLLWARQIVHRDVKPQNIIVRPAGTPAVLDLGIARLLELDSITRTLAASGPCTPPYASPEQISNRKDWIDHRSDQYSLGIVYGQLLLHGNHPFDPGLVGVGESIVENILGDVWAKPLLEASDARRTLPILSRMLGHEPYVRFRRGEELLKSLHTILENEQ